MTNPFAIQNNTGVETVYAGGAGRTETPRRETPVCAAPETAAELLGNAAALLAAEPLASMRGESFLDIKGLSSEQIGALVDLAAALKALKRASVRHAAYEGRNVALIFEKTSTRTRCAFEVAAADLGMHPVFLDPQASQINKKESIADTARVLGRMFDGIEYRGFGQEIVEDLAAYAGVPVWNGLTNESHPTQIIADLLTIREHFGKLAGIRFVYMGDARYNMANSLMMGCAKMGMHFIACTAAAYFPDPKLVKEASEIAESMGGSVTLSSDTACVAGADVIYTDVWVSMGEPDDVWEQRIEALAPYQVNTRLMMKAGPQCRFMHCLPAYHDHNTKVGQQVGERFGLDCLEVSNAVFEGLQSIVFDEAENRLHSIKAVMAATLTPTTELASLAAKAAKKAAKAAKKQAKAAKAAAKGQAKAEKAAKKTKAKRADAGEKKHANQ